MNPSLVLPVSYHAARAWAKGWIGDLELMLGDHPAGQALYIATLPALDAWRAVLPSLVAHYRSGVRIIILRTNTPAVVRHIEKWGAFKTVQDPSGRWRYLADPGAVARYFGRLDSGARVRA